MYSASDLNESERFALHRRRLGYTGAEYQKKFSVSKNRLTSWEKGKETETIPPVILHPKMTVGEALFIARRRRGWDIRETAALMGISHVTYVKWEKDRTSDETLLKSVRFWNRRGWPKKKRGE